jgi:hypothetical protein
MLLVAFASYEQAAGRVGRVIDTLQFYLRSFLRDVVFIKMATAVHCCAHLFPVTC